MIGSFETHLQDPDQMCGTVHLLKLDRTSKTSKRKELLSICLYMYLTRFDQLYTKIRKNHMKKLQGLDPGGGAERYNLEVMKVNDGVLIMYVRSTHSGGEMYAFERIYGTFVLPLY